MAPTSSTAALTLAAMLALAAVSADSTRASNSTSNTSAPSEQADSAEGSGGGVRARQLFGFGPGNLFQNGPLGGSLGSGFPFGGFGGVPGFGGAPFNPFLNGSPGNGQFNNGNPTVGGGLGSSPFPNNPQGSGGFNGNSGGPVEPRPDQVGNQFNNGRPAFGNGQALNGNGNQFNNGRPAFGNGQALNGNGNQFGGGSGEVPPTNGNQFNNGGRPAFGNGQALNGNGNQQFGGGSGEVPPTNGNQFNNGGRPAGPVRPGGQAGPARPVGVPPAANQPPQRPAGAAPTTSPLQPQQPQQPQQRDALINPMDCGIRDEDRIIGGNLTSVMELPWMARLGYTSRRGGISYRCGGSLINHRYVLTAAHCVGDGEDPVQVRLGEWDEDSERDCSLIAGSNVCAPPVVDVPIERVIRHPQYSSDTQSPNYLKNDIALLRLRSPVTFSEAVKPICLPEQGAVQVKTPTGSKAIVAGWGKDRNRGSTGTRYLLKASVPLWSVPECTRVYQSRGVRVGPTQVCAGGTRGIDSCQGDSGGPLYRPGLVHEQPRAVQIGVVSFGLKDCATEGVPGVYTRVESHMPWVTSNLAP